MNELPTTDATRAALPNDSVALVFTSTSDGYDIVNKDTGEFDSNVPPWSNLQIYVVLAPTEFGWQEYWYGTR